MTLISKDHDKVGTRQYLLIINGYDDEREVNTDIETRWFDTRELAQARGAIALGDIPEALDADIYEYEWIELEYTDPKYGHILDAEQVERSSQYGCRHEGGTVVWDEPEVTR